MKEYPLVSVALCTYNGEKYISQQLDSIQLQTYRNLEIIIVDDCSTDGTVDILKAYEKKDSRIKCFQNAANKGFNKNFEYAIELTTADYIAISDQDDIWLPQKLEILLNNIEGNWLIFSNSSFIDDDNEQTGGDILENYNPVNYGYKGMLLANFVTGHTTLFRRELLNYILPFPQEGFYDWWMGFVALYHKKIVFLDKILTKYRIHEASVIQQRENSTQKKSKKNATTAYMLSSFAAYKNLGPNDRTFIEALKNAYNLNLSGVSSIPIIKMVMKYYEILFPYLKKRKWFSLLNFTFKYSRKVKK